MSQVVDQAAAALASVPPAVRWAVARLGSLPAFPSPSGAFRPRPPWLGGPMPPLSLILPAQGVVPARAAPTPFAELPARAGGPLAALENKRRRTGSPPVEVEQRRHAVSIWALLAVDAGVLGCGVVEQLTNDGLSASLEEVATQMANCLRDRAVPTILKRGRSMLMFRRWAEATDVPLFYLSIC